MHRRDFSLLTASVSLAAPLGAAKLAPHPVEPVQRRAASGHRNPAAPRRATGGRKAR